MNGRAIGQQVETSDPERNLLAAACMCAWEDARGGDLWALLWLAFEGAPLADEHLGIDPAMWGRAVAPPEGTKPAIRTEKGREYNRLYIRKYRERKRAERLAVAP